ncbi:hypothetical protein [Lysinibacillus sp. NPDC056232]|uniref:hypothetical protein n=1 Tax=Lysinibacillus sp. NPDC056232 TaxID=3345756 RepID=UPI0035DE53EB
MKRRIEKRETEGLAEVTDRRAKATERFPGATDKIFESTERKKGAGKLHRSDG